MPDFLIRPLIYLAISVGLFFTGFIKGCEHESAKYKQAETKFVERVKVVTQIERVEVPKFVEKIKWLTETKTQLIEAAKNEAPNPASCDLSTDRVRRINQAAASHTK